MDLNDLTYKEKEFLTADPGQITTDKTESFPRST
jgi:hypothetical protein